MNCKKDSLCEFLIGFTILILSQPLGMVIAKFCNPINLHWDFLQKYYVLEIINVIVLVFSMQILLQTQIRRPFHRFFFYLKFNFQYQVLAIFIVNIIYGFIKTYFSLSTKFL